MWDLLHANKVIYVLLRNVWWYNIYIILLCTATIYNCYLTSLLVRMAS